MKNEHLTAGVYHPSQEVEHSVQIFLCSIFFATSEKQWSWMSVNTEDRNRVWRVIFKLLTIQIYSFLWYSLQHLKIREVVCQSTLRRGGGSQIRETLIANPLQIHWAGKQAITEAAQSHRDYIRIASGATDTFTETSWFHRKGKNFVFHAIFLLITCQSKVWVRAWRVQITRDDLMRHDISKSSFEKVSCQPKSTKSMGCKILRKLGTH